MNPSIRGFATICLAIASMALIMIANPAKAAGPAGTSQLATTVGELNADLRGNLVTDVRRGRRGFRGGRGFRRGRAFRGRGFRGRRFGRIRRGNVRRFRRGRVRGFRRHRLRRRYYRPRIYYSTPYVYYGYRSSYSRRCYKPCRWAGHSRRYCRRYCRRHRYY